MTPKPIFSELAERQTISVRGVSSRVSIRTRLVGPNDKTHDVLVDGYVYTPMVSEQWIAKHGEAIIALAANRAETHIGYGQWVAR